jgi:hypothetical protein
MTEIVPGALCARTTIPLGALRELSSQQMHAMPPRRESPKRRGINPGAYWCEHNKPMLVTRSERGSYYARCLACLEIGPERTSSEAARQALLLLGASADGRYNGTVGA